MRCVVGEVEEEGFVRGVLKMLVEEKIGMLGNALGEVVVISGFDRFVIQCQLGCPVAGPTADHAVEAVKAALPWPGAFFP